MKLITKQEEQAHYSAVLRAGSVGGALGLGAGLAGVFGASYRYPGFRSLTVWFRTFLVYASTMAGGYVAAEHASINFGRARNPYSTYKTADQRVLEQAKLSESSTRRFLDWGKEHKYAMVWSSWATALVIAFTMLSRNKYLTVPQKVVQARVYAQAPTVALVVGLAAMERTSANQGKDKWATVKVADPTHPGHLIEKRIHKEEYKGQDLWKDMVAAEERRLRSLGWRSTKDGSLN